MLEPFGREEDEKFGLNSELFNTLKRGTTLVEYRYVYQVVVHLMCLPLIDCHQTESVCLCVAALQISPKNSMLDTCDLQLLVSFGF